MQPACTELAGYSAIGSIEFFFTKIQIDFQAIGLDGFDANGFIKFGTTCFYICPPTACR